jgi:hypothetical protein
MNIYLEHNSEESFKNFVDLCLCPVSYLYEAVTSKKIEYTILADLTQEQTQRMYKLTSNSARVKFNWSKEFNQIDSHTDKPESPVAEVSRLLLDNFEITNTFSTIDLDLIANLIDRKLSTPKIHKAVLDNFEGVKFRKQNGGFIYTLRQRNTAV